MSGPMVVVGGGAIGGTLAARMTRAGHDVLICDADEAHVAAIREHGLASLEDVEAIILEADSDFSVVRRAENKSDSALADVAH